MKKNKFLSLLGLMLMAAALTTFTACSGSDDDNNQSGTTSMSPALKPQMPSSI